MKTLTGILTAALLLVGCNKEEPAAPVEVDTSTYSERGADNSWPKRPEESALPVADDLTASNYYVVMDASGSMFNAECSEGRRKLDVAKEALSSFFQQLPSTANVGMFAFDKHDASERLSLGSYAPEYVSGVANSLVAGGGTPLLTGIQVGMRALSVQAMKQLGYGEYHLVVVTDGVATSGYEPTSAVNELLADTPIVVHTIGFCIDDSHSLNRPGLTLYESANDPQSLLTGLEAVLAEAPDFQVGAFVEEQP